MRGVSGSLTHTPRSFSPRGAGSFESRASCPLVRAGLPPPSCPGRGDSKRVPRCLRRFHTPFLVYSPLRP